MIIDKEGKICPFILNDIQNSYLEKRTQRDIILKARQQGFSSLILALFGIDFIMMENSYSVVIADNADNAKGLLERVKFFLKSYEQINKIKIPLKYDSKYELHNSAINSKYIIGTAENTEVGRSKTITNLHLSEAAFYKHLLNVIASAGQAVTPSGYFVVETTANGYNEFRKWWVESQNDETGFQPLFYGAQDFYSPEFLEQKKKELKEKYQQEYPTTWEEAFLTSGEMYFNHESLTEYLKCSSPTAI